MQFRVEHILEKRIVGDLHALLSGIKINELLLQPGRKVQEASIKGRILLQTGKECLRRLAFFFSQFSESILLFCHIILPWSFHGRIIIKQYCVTLLLSGQPYRQNAFRMCFPDHLNYQDTGKKRVKRMLRHAVHTAPETVRTQIRSFISETEETATEMSVV